MGDAVLSFWAPNLIEALFKSPVTMGFIISFNSVVGFGVDLFLPQIFKSVPVKNLLFWSVAGVILFSSLMLLGIRIPHVAIFLLAVAVWGVYFEFFGFASHQFIADTVPSTMHVSSWAFLSVFKNLAYLLGPLLGGYFMLVHQGLSAWMAVIFTLTGGVILLFSRRSHSHPLGIDLREISLSREFEHLAVLAKNVWPLVAVSLVIGVIDSFFWTAGAVWTEKLIRENIWGVFLIPAYQLPSLFMGFILIRLKIYEGKKRLSQKFMFLAGLFLAAVGFTRVIPFQIILVFLASTMLSVTYPLTDAVYSDLVGRLGRKRNHLIGLCGSLGNLAYIIGPILAGFLVKAIGERDAFARAGMAMALVALILLFFTPKKLRLPQAEIKHWEK